MKWSFHRQQILLVNPLQVRSLPPPAKAFRFILGPMQQIKRLIYCQKRKDAVQFRKRSCFANAHKTIMGIYETLFDNVEFRQNI